MPRKTFNKYLANQIGMRCSAKIFNHPKLDRLVIEKIIAKEINEELSDLLDENKI